MEDQKFDEAEIYDKTSLEQREDGLILMDKLTPEAGSRILDLGCGTGYLTKILADRVGPEGKVVGTDPNLERMEVARKKYPAPNLEYLEGSAECIPGDGYDMVYCNQVLHWCKDKDVVFKQVHKSLKTGGKFGFVTTTDMEVIPNVFTSDMVSPEFEKAVSDMMRLLTIGQYKELIATSNFEIVYLEEKRRDWKFADVYKLIEQMRVHSAGEFDMTHFNVDAMKSHYGEGELVVTAPYCLVVVRKTN